MKCAQINKYALVLAFKEFSTIIIVIIIIYHGYGSGYKKFMCIYYGKHI